MNDNNEEFVAYPKDFEEAIRNQVATVDPKNILEETRNIIETTQRQQPEENESTESSINIQTSVGKRKRIREPKLPPKNDDNFYRIATLLLLFARKDMYNEKFEIKNNVGNFIPGTNIVRFLKFAVRKQKKFPQIDAYVDAIKAIQDDKNDIISLIRNPMLVGILKGSITNKDSEEQKQMQQFMKRYLSPSPEAPSDKKRKFDDSDHGNIYLYDQKATTSTSDSKTSSVNNDDESTAGRQTKRFKPDPDVLPILSLDDIDGELANAHDPEMDMWMRILSKDADNFRDNNGKE